MDVVVWLKSPYENRKLIQDNETLIVGRSRKTAIPEARIPRIGQIWVDGRRGLSRRALVLHNAGSELRIASEQMTETGHVVLDFPDGSSLRLTGVHRFSAPAEVGVRICVYDGLDDVLVTVRVGGRAVDDPESTALDERLGDDDEGLLLVNSIALAADETEQGRLVAPKAVKKFFLPAVGAAETYDRKFDSAAAALGRRYGFEDRRGLMDLLSAGRRQGDVRPEIMDRLRKGTRDV